MSSLAVENLVYAASVMAMVGVGLVVAGRDRAAAASLAHGDRGRAGGDGRRRRSSRFARCAARGIRRRGARPRWRERLAAVREEVLRFSGGHPRRLWRVFALDLAFHALAVARSLPHASVGARRSQPDAAAGRSRSRRSTASSPSRSSSCRSASASMKLSAGALAPLLAVNPAAGVALAVVRKVRNLFWAAIGLILVAAHPAEANAATKARRRFSHQAHEDLLQRSQDL